MDGTGLFVAFARDESIVARKNTVRASRLVLMLGTPFEFRKIFASGEFRKGKLRVGTREFSEDARA